MSVRIYELAKKTGLETRRIIEILLERGYQVKSASSTVDSITAEELVEEFDPYPPAPMQAAGEQANSDYVQTAMTNPSDTSSDSIPQSDTPNLVFSTTDDDFDNDFFLRNEDDFQKNLDHPEGIESKVKTSQSEAPVPSTRKQYKGLSYIYGTDASVMSSKFFTKYS